MLSIQDLMEFYFVIISAENAWYCCVFFFCDLHEIVSHGIAQGCLLVDETFLAVWNTTSHDVSWPKSAVVLDVCGRAGCLLPRTQAHRFQRLSVAVIDNTQSMPSVLVASSLGFELDEAFFLLCH